MRGERSDVRRALAQRRHGNREHIEAEEKVLAESASGDGPREIGVRERHQARFHAQRFGAAQAFEGALFEHAQELRLHSGRKRRHFVEDDRAALRHLEPARLARHRARKRPALVAEKLGFDKLRGQAGAVNFQERRIAARSALVNPARELILAGAALAGDQKRGRGLGEFFGEFENAQRSRVGRHPHDVRRAHASVVPPSDSPCGFAGRSDAGKSTRSAVRQSRSRS